MLNFKQFKQNLQKDTTTLPSLKVVLLGDTATQFLSLGLRGTAIERGYNLNLFETEYNQVERQFLDVTSELYTFQPDYAVVFRSTHKLLSFYNTLPEERQIHLADECLEFVQLLCESFPGRLIYCNYPEIDDAVFGSFSNKTEHSFTYQVRKLNYELMNLAIHNHNFFICDIATIQNKMGRDALFDPSVYVNTDMVISLDCIPVVASKIMDIICAAQGQIKKCLILDLDNTLWGGVIGDDGLENIQLGHNLGIGKIFTEFQYWIKNLKNRGIIIAVCSKNDEHIAKEPFIKHPDMVLKLDDISVFMANWENKVDNIRQIQAVLNIGFDSMIFLDDNPAERAIVHENIPAITVPELPEDPACYLEYLYSLNLFETVSYSTVDGERTKQYQIEEQRVSSQKTFTDEKDFLKSLDMVGNVKGFDSFSIPRVAQLSQRSNQFNLRTIRYTEADIARLSADDRYKCFNFSLADKFGDNGLVCVVILEKQNMDEIGFPKKLFIDTWFMSCRVLKRGMEDFTLNTIVQYAKENGFSQIIGEYIATPKNKMVEEHYLKLGFVRLANIGKHLYFLNTDEYHDRECYIKTVVN
jgi:FkbH-like protein